MSGTEFAKAKEDTAAIMRAKQAAGTYPSASLRVFARRRCCEAGRGVKGRGLTRVRSRRQEGGEEVESRRGDGVRFMHSERHALPGASRGSAAGLGFGKAKVCTAELGYLEWNWFTTCMCDVFLTAQLRRLPNASTTSFCCTQSTSRHSTRKIEKRVAENLISRRASSLNVSMLVYHACAYPTQECHGLHTV